MKRIVNAAFINTLLSCLVLFSIVSCSEKDVVKKSSDKKIISFNFSLTPKVVVSIDSVNSVISATLPIGADLTKLAPVIEISALAKVSPESGVVQDFTKPVVYTVTAEDGSTRVYTAQITALKSSENKLISFKFSELTPEVTGSITTLSSETVVDLNVPKSISLKALKPTIVISPRATISPASGIAQDFSNGFTYTITAENGSERKLTVKVKSVEPSPKITEISSTTFKAGDIITVKGENFSTNPAANQLTLLELDGASADDLDIVSGTATELKIKVSPNIVAKKYSGIYVRLPFSSVSGTAFNSSITMLPIDLVPVITGIDKTTYKLGDVITISGKNFVFPGADVMVKYYRTDSGNAVNFQMATVNADGSISIKGRDVERVGEKLKIRVQVGNVTSALFDQEIERIQ